MLIGATFAGDSQVDGVPEVPALDPELIRRGGAVVIVVDPAGGGGAERGIVALIDGQRVEVLRVGAPRKRGLC